MQARYLLVRTSAHSKIISLWRNRVKSHVRFSSSDGSGSLLASRKYLCRYQIAELLKIAQEADFGGEGNAQFRSCSLDDLLGDIVDVLGGGTSRILNLQDVVRVQPHRAP